MTDSDADAQRKFLVLGSSLPTPHVTSYSWDEIPPGLNVADFDTVILNLHPLSDIEVANSVELDTVPPSHQFARLLFSSGSQIIVIGNPFVQIGGNPYIYSTWWLPVSPRFLSETGDTVELKDPDYASYFDKVAHWDFCFAGWEDTYPDHFQGYMYEAGMPRAVGIRGRIYPIAENRYGRAVAFSASFEALSQGGGSLGESGIVEWLPPPTEIGVDEAVELILRERFGIAREEAVPPWLHEFMLPNEYPIIERIDGLEEEIGSLATQLDQARSDLKGASHFRRILYETGEDVLEPIVRDALAQLEASIELPKVRGREDGRLTDPSGRLGTMEIKGRSGQLRVGDVRQTHQWVADRIAYEDSKSKGILIANLNKDLPPSERGDVFPQNCVSAAENFDICLLTTTQLFNALSMQQNSTLELTDFWDAIFHASGISEFPELGSSD